MTGPAATAARRLEFRGDVTTAAGALPVSWPISTFIAVNPLGGLEGLEFHAALRRAGELFGARGTLDPAQFRQLYARGRIDAQDLRAAIIHHVPHVPTHPGVTVAGTHWNAVSILECDLLHGTVAAAPQRSVYTRSEVADPRIAGIVDAQTSKWCAAFFGARDAPWPMPGRSRGLYRAWRDLAWRDRSLSGSVRSALRALPPRADDAALAALATIGVDDDERVDYLRADLTRMPGWASHVRWHNDHNGGDQDGGVDLVDLVDYLAIRLTYEAELLRASGHTSRDRPAPPTAHASPSLSQRAAAVAARLTDSRPTATELLAITEVLAMLPVELGRLVWQHAYEHHYRARLLEQLDAQDSADDAARPEAQLVCCIDTRSEELRRQLEALGPYETLGFAGFFAVAISYRQLGSVVPSDQCPVLIAPRNPVTEQPTDPGSRAVRRAETGRTTLTAGEGAFYTAKYDTLSPFALAEAAGWAAGPIATAKTLAPAWHDRLRRTAARVIRPSPATAVDVDGGFTAEDKYLFARAALTMMGLTTNFAPLVVLSGHGSSTENNPYAAALHCGACGGHRGAPNARTAAAILNDPNVRTHLRTHDIEIPDDTWFVAAEHDTARDTVELLDVALVPGGHRPGLDRLAASLAEAGARSGVRRAEVLPGAPRSRKPRRVLRHVRTRSCDWAQVYPEWGLAGNACFIVGPRAMTAGIDLNRRAFLHSYEAAADPTGAGLETILTAPLIVAQWINHQYYFSAVDPEAFGAGTKTIHNVVGSAGVLAGHTGDLQLGLPWQSVGVGSDLIHEPLRLLAIVQAPLAHIDAIIDRNPMLQNLIGNDWIALIARETHGEPWQQHTRSGWHASPYRKSTTHD